MEDHVKKMLIVSSNNVLIQFFRYAIVGGIAAAADILVFHAAANIFCIYYITSKVISFTVGLFVNYFFSRRWVFNKKDSTVAADFVPFAIIGIIGLLLSIFLLYVLIDRGFLHVIFPSMEDKLLKVTANAVSIFLVLFWNFTGRRKIVFKQSKGETI